MRRVIDIFSAGGVAVEVTEAQIDDVAAISGSGAAYIYYMVENLRDAAIEAGNRAGDGRASSPNRP